LRALRFLSELGEIKTQKLNSVGKPPRRLTIFLNSYINDNNWGFSKTSVFGKATLDLID